MFEMLRTNSLAEYFMKGDEEYWRHYALNIDCYTHFTSPIRRYPDILVHRMLGDYLEQGEKKAVEMINDVLNCYKIRAISFQSLENVMKRKLKRKGLQKQWIE